MPFAFPSHQGLILPAGRRWPGWFDLLALCVGAAMPDVVDGVRGFIFGHMGQEIGHSLLGTFILCWPAGIGLTWLITVADRRGRLRKVLHRATHWPDLPGARRPAITWSISLVVGSLSHIAFDAISHERIWALYPWRGPMQIFPAWCYRAWFRIPLPMYERPYPFGPHTVMWCALSILGAVMFFRPLALHRKVALGPGAERKNSEREAHSGK